MTIRWLLVLVLPAGLLAGCDSRSHRTQAGAASGTDAYDDQMQRNDKLIRDAERQNKLTDAAFEKRDEQDRKTDALIEKYEEQTKRYDKVLGKWEEQAVRFDALMDKAEKGLKD